MKILHVNDNYTEGGGTQQYLLSVIGLLEQYDHQNIVIYRNRKSNTIRNGCCPSYRVEGNETTYQQVAKIIASEKPDVAYIHHVHSATLINAVSKLLPAIGYVHGLAPVCPGLAKTFRRNDIVCQRPFGWGCIPMNYLRRCSDARHPQTVLNLFLRTAELRDAYLTLPGVMVASSYMKELLIQNKFDPHRLFVLPPHFVVDNDVPDILPSNDPNIILFAGRLEREKGFPYLLNGLAEMPASVQLLVAGDGTLRGGYERMVDSLGLTARVQFLGWLSQQGLSAVLEKSNILAMPSIWPEPFGKIGVEALIHGRPVVAFDVGGISEWLHDGYNGFLVEPVNYHQFAKRVVQLLGDSKLRTEMGKRGQSLAKQQFNSRNHLKVLISAFKKLLSQRVGD